MNNLLSYSYSKQIILLLCEGRALSRKSNINVILNPVEHVRICQNAYYYRPTCIYISLMSGHIRTLTWS